ncbi:Acetyl-coenzyme A synthetase, chloroplastic/glyoxysomal [Porphyridium purpureum]|uniref:Acetyl-coenzyme A synthetase n=1 Tax=Porphyridium purpureum TaxID=35688 RepID=A0A5J4YUN2_PORPP|nr:Acetyl-coenzyme A synthetase, chloroplastic/glyoxysomal [Porphyridium purpureum]|eukprot:POR0798..scf227_4
MVERGASEPFKLKSAEADHLVEHRHDDDIVTMPLEGLHPAPHLRDMEHYQQMYKRSIAEPEQFWDDIARTGFYWKQKWDAVRSVNFSRKQGRIESSWFIGSKTNICFNALDRWVETGIEDHVAFLFEPNDLSDDKSRREWTYGQTLAEVKRVANVLKAMGVKKGDCVTLYMPMVVELPVCMLACARIGAVHSVVFGGFSAEALAGRILDAESKVVITCDGVMRGKKPILLKQIADKACEIAQKRGFAVASQLVLHRLEEDKSTCEMRGGRDVWYDEAVARADTECEVEWMDAEDPLFILYTSGSTGSPKGVLHTTAGYMVYTATTFKYSFDYQPRDVFFCTADCGWITGHSYVTYGPLLNAATQVVFEGVPTYPDAGRLWDIVQRYRVNQIYTAPTAIRALKAYGDSYVQAYDRSSLRVLGTVGEPINPEAWRWYFEVVGSSKCAVVDTWWQTETGGHMIVSFGVKGMKFKPGSASLPSFGVDPVLLDEQGQEIEGPGDGFLMIRQGWPSTIRTVRGDHERMEQVYFDRFDGYYLTGDGCRRDADGYYWLTGRIDDILNVSGHRIGTAEVESALVLHELVNEAAVVGFGHDIKGEGIYAFVTLNQGAKASESLQKELIALCRSEIGPIATPDRIQWVPGLPKTRSGKIMRRILRKIAEQGGSVKMEDLGDITTLADPSVVAQLIASV